MNTITAHIEIHPEQLAGALSPATLAKALFEKLTAPAEVGTVIPTKASTPAPIGAMWPEQGGIYAGVMRSEWGHNYHLIIAPRDTELSDIEWGEDDKMISGAISDRNGLSNSLAIRDYAKSIDKRFPAISHALSLTANGFNDWYLPARHELRLAYLNASETFNLDGWYWTSTQYAGYASTAWGQYFDGGGQGYGDKGYKGRVRAVRRFLID